MAILSESFSEPQDTPEILTHDHRRRFAYTGVGSGWWGKYRQTILFAVTALVVMAIATYVAATKVNGVIAGLAENQVIGLAEENTTRDALHIQSMVRGGQGMSMSMKPGHSMGGESMSGESMGGESMGEPAMGDSAMDAGGHPMSESGSMTEPPMPASGNPLTLETLIRPDGLPAQFDSLVEGLGVVEASLFDNDGIVVWSTNPDMIGLAETHDGDIETATAGQIVSTLSRDEEVTDIDGHKHRMDVVQTFVPIQDTPSDPVIGVLEMHREVGADLGLLVEDTKSTVIWTTVGTMAGLFMALVGFVVVADRSNYRSHQRQIALVEERLAERTEAERKISEHALALEVSNRELEAFSYSVSHDLRSPLRTIDGFSMALMEDYGDKLDEDGKSALTRVRAGTQRMGILIDAMLQMSRVSRGEMVMEVVDISEMARAIAAEFNSAEPERNAEFVIHDGMTARCDPRLMRGVYQNLLANAWKFTSKNPTSRIEVGTMPHEGQTAFFVRDDGAGFDMEYADKLFGAFQRLHGMTEFEGTGVGLATAQRIVHRHGGQIWAHGEVDKGATIYFTLSPSRLSNGHVSNGKTNSGESSWKTE